MTPFSKLMSKNRLVWSIYSSVSNKFNFILSYFFPILASKKQFKAAFDRSLNLSNPKTLNEKLMYLKIEKYWDNKFIANCVDKYTVRQYVRDKGCSELLTKLYGVWDNVEDINWDSLPKKFAIKCNHGSGYNLICKDKSKFDIIDATNKLNKWINEMYGIRYVEQGIYRKIKRRIIAEEFIETSDGLPPKDYKFFCSYGKVKFLFVATDRYDNQTKFDYYYPDWTYIPVKNYFDNNGPIEKPNTLKKMIYYAEILSDEFPIVRVDFYSEGNRIIFGELTFTHFGCLNKFEPDQYDYDFGSLFPDIQKLEKWDV